MWKNNHLPKQMKTQLLTSVLLVACCLLIIGSFSWFSNNRKTDGKEDQIITEEESDAILGDYTIFMRSTKEDSDGNKINSYKVLNSLENVTLSPYDSVFGRNEDTAIILRIPVSGKHVDGKQALSFTLSRANTDELSEYCSDAYGLKANATDDDLNIEQDKIINYLTNIATFKFAIIPSLNDYKSTQENAQAIYEGAKTVFDSKDNPVTPYTFAEQTKSGKIYTVTKTTNEIIWNLDADYGEGKLTADGTLYIYVEIDYDKYLTAAYLQNHEANFAVGKLGQTQLLEFVGDLSMLEVSPASAQ
ncbi:MAG: hypothetical protein ACI4TK_06610 [Agathobacter sp.]